MDIIHLAHDELEALHLCDGEGKTQQEAGFCMGISRGTVQRLLSSARRKVAQVLVEQKALAIAGNQPEIDESTAPGKGPAIKPLDPVDSGEVKKAARYLRNKGE